VTNPGSYESVENIVERVKVVKGEGQDVHPGLPNRGGDSATVRVPIVIVGNKRDLPNDRRVSTDMGRALAERLHCKFFETSARIHDDVEAVFKEIVRQIKVAKNLHNPPRGGPEPVSPSGSTQPGSSRSRKTKKCVIL
jgi:GTPase SAR1 family protein